MSDDLIRRPATLRSISSEELATHQPGNKVLLYESALSNVFITIEDLNDGKAFVVYRITLDAIDTRVDFGGDVNQAVAFGNNLAEETCDDDQEIYRRKG